MNSNSQNMSMWRFIWQTLVVIAVLAIMSKILSVLLPAYSCYIFTAAGMIGLALIGLLFAFTNGNPWILFIMIVAIGFGRYNTEKALLTNLAPIVIELIVMFFGYSLRRLLRE